MLLKRIDKTAEASYEVRFALTAEEQADLEKAIALVDFYKKTALGALEIQVPVGDICSYAYKVKKGEAVVSLTEAVLG